MAVDFATPIAHQTHSNYAAFNNAIAPGRPFRQPLQTAPNSGNFASGLELFLSSAGDVANLYSWFDCIIGWQPGSATQPGDRLILTTQPHVLSAPGATRTLASLKTLEARPQQAIYENVERMAVQSALETILTGAYNAATAAPGNSSSWHPSMRMRIRDTSGTRTLKAHLDNSAPVSNRITQLINDFLTGGAGAAITQIPVKAGELIGRAAGYRASDPLPASPPFPLGNATDANRARRLTFMTIDQGGQFLNPLYYLNVYMRQMLEPVTNRIVRSLTDIVDGGILRHPLVDLFPAIATTNPPAAREQVNGQYKFPIGELHNWHGYPGGTPISQLEWRYNDATEFEARARITGTPVPRLSPNNNETTKVTNLWNPPGPDAGVGDAIGIICEELQVPCELILALAGSEALQNLDPRATRMEPLKDSNRIQLRVNGISPAHELAYDQMVGRQATVTAATLRPNNTTRLAVTLPAATSWAANVLRTRNVRLLVGNVDRLSITANTTGSNVSNSTLAA